MGFFTSVLGDVAENMVKATGECANCGDFSMGNTCSQCGSHVCFPCYRANLEVYDTGEIRKTFVFTCPVCGEQSMQKAVFGPGA